MFPILYPLPPPSPYHPSGSSQRTSPKHPVSFIKPRLAIRFTYDNIHVSMPFSQIVPPLPSPTESKRLFYTSVSLLLSRIQVIVTIFLNSIYMCYYSVLVFFFLAYFTLYNRLLDLPNQSEKFIIMMEKGFFDKNKTLLHRFELYKSNPAIIYLEKL